MYNLGQEIPQFFGEILCIEILNGGAESNNQYLNKKNEDKNSASFAVFFPRVTNSIFWRQCRGGEQSAQKETLFHSFTLKTLN